MVITITTDSNNSILTSGCTTNTNLSNSIHHNDDNSQQRQENSEIKSITNDESPIEKQKMQNENQKHNDKKKQQHEEKQQELKIQIQSTKKIENYRNNIKNDTMIATPTIDIEIESDEEREEGEIIDEFEDISSDEEMLMMKRIEELEAKNAELEKIENISGIYDYDIDYIDDRYKKANTSSKYDYHSADDNDDCHNSKSYLISNKKRLTTSRRTSPLITVKYPLLPLEITANTSKDSNSKYHNHRHHHHHCHRHRHHHHHHRNHNRNEYKTIQSHHFDDIYDDVYGEKERVYIYDDDDNKSNDGLEYISQSSVSSIESIQPVKRRKRKRKYEKISKCVKRKTIKSGKKKKKLSRNHQIPAVASFNSDDEDNDCILDRDELRKALKRDVTTTTKTATATVTAKNSKNIQNYHRSNEKDSMINSKNNKKIRTIDLVSEEEEEDTNKIDNCIVVEENEKEPCDIEDESDDDSASLEEQELRLIALKSAIEHKHLTRKRRRESDEKRPYTPSDNFAEMFDSCINNDDDYNKDLYSFSPSDLDISPPPISSEITDTFANNSMDISPLSSPELIMSDNVGCDYRSAAVSTVGGGVVYNDSTDSLLKPIDMELANSDSSNNPTPIFEQQQQQQNSSQQIYNFYDNNCWIPIEKIPLPQDYDVRQNQEIQQSHHIHCPTAMKLLPPKSSFQPLMPSITPSSLSSSPVLLQQQQQQQLEHHQQQQKNINIDDNEKVVIRSASSLGSEKIDNADSTDEEELALRALLLANMNSKQKSKNQHNSSIEELIEEKNLENQSNNHSNDNNKENKPSIILKSYNAGDMKNCDIIADDSSTSSNDIEILKNLLLKTMNDMNYSNSNNDDRNLQQNHDENITHKTELVLKEAVKRLKQKSTTVTPVKENLQDNVQEQKQQQQQQQQQRLCDSKKSPSSFICFTNTTSILNENYINSTKDLLPDYNTNNDINISHNHNENDVEKMVDIFEKVHFDNNNRTELNYKKQKNSELLKNNDYDDEKNENLLNEIKNKKSDDISDQKRNSKCDQNLIKNTNKKKSITKSSLATTKSTTLLRPTLVTTTKTQSSSNKISDVENLNSNTTRMTKTRTKIINNHKNTASIIETTNTGPLSFVKKRKIVRTTTNRNEMAAVASSSSSASLAAAVSARAPLKITQNLKTGTRLITKAEIPKVEKIIIQLGVESSTSSAESSESESDHESDSNTNNCSKYNQNSTYNDSSIASPISLQMDSPVYSPIPNQNHQQSTLLDYQDQNQFENSNDNLEKNITNDIFQAKLDEFLKNARIKVEQTKKEVNTNEGVVGIGGNSSSSIGAGTSNAIKSNDDDDNNRTVSNEIDEKPAAATKAVKSNVLPLKAITTKTPVAVRHLPQSSQLEYRRLINRMKILEKQKLARHIKMNVNRDNLKGTMKEDETNRNDNVGITNESTTATSAATATGTVTGITAVGIVTETEVGATTESASTTVPIKETTNQRLQILTDNSNSNNLNDDIMNSSKNEISKEFNQQKDKLIKKVLIKNASNVIATSLTESSSSSVSVSHNKNDANDDENNLINTNIQKNEQENCSDTKETVIMNEINIESEISSNKLVKAQNENVHVNDIEMVDVEKTKDDDSTLPINKENDSVTNLEEEKKDENMKIESISISSSSSSGNSNVDINDDDDKLTTKSQLTKVNKNNIELLKKYENEVNKKSCILNDSITKTIDLITIARKEKYHKFLLQKKFEHLKAQMQLIENDLNKQNLKLSKIYPDVMNSHKKIINIKTNYINLEKITMNLGRNIYGDDYRIENDNKKSIILNKSKQFSIEMKKLKDLKQSDLNENVTIEWKISNDNKKNNSNSSSSSSNNTTMMTVNDSKMMNDDNNQEFNLNTVKTIEVHTENLTKMDDSCSVVIEDSQSNCTIEKEENQLNEKCTVNGQQKENVLSSEVKTNDKMEIDLIENVENIQTVNSKTTSIEEEDKIDHRTETINIDKIVAVKNIESETILKLSDKTTTEGEEQILQIADEDNSNLEKISNENVICESENYQKSNDDDNSRISSVEQNEEISNRKEQINENITNNMKSSLPSISSFTENSNDENNLIKSTDLVKNYVSPLDHIKQKRTIIDDPNGIICPYQLMGQCDDKECKFVHLPNNDA